MHPKGTSRGMVGQRYVSTPLFRRLVYIVAGQPPRRHVVGFDVIAVRCKRSHTIFWSDSTIFYRLCGVGCTGLLFWARTLAPYRIGRVLGANLTYHNHLSLNAICGLLVQRDCSETWPTCLSQYSIMLLGAAVQAGLMSSDASCAVVQPSSIFDDACRR